jgi:phytoene dehydrogenase-like protein
VSDYEVIVVGAGHNGLVAATLLARSGRRVLLLEARQQVGGAASSASPWPQFDARLSRYSYLVSLFPRWLLNDLGVRLELRRRPVSSYTPVGDGGVLDRAGLALPGSHQLAAHVFPTLTQPLSAPVIAHPLFERPLGELLLEAFDNDVVRGIVATDGLIGTFASLEDPSLAANRCYLYHVIGGRWDLPVGGMGALSSALLDAALSAGVHVRTDERVVAIDADAPGPAVVRCVHGTEWTADDLVCGVAPALLAKLLGDRPRESVPEGSQLKLNLLLSRLPRLRDPDVAPEQAFGGTFHVNESYSQLQAAYAQAAGGQIPSLVPCEAYCHSLSDPSILGPSLRAVGAQTLTVFALHMPARLFAADGAKEQALAATLRSLDSVLAEPIEECVMRTADGELCIEVKTPLDLERELGMPGGNIFHRPLQWPFAESEQELGSWGVETSRPNVWICGAGARRGGGVSGIPGHNCALAILGR